MEVLVNDFHFNMAKVKTEINLFQWLRLKLTGKTFVQWLRKPGWLGVCPFYIARCRSCGEYFLDYPHGYDGRLDCPVCDYKPSSLRRHKT